MRPLHLVAMQQPERMMQPSGYAQRVKDNFDRRSSTYDTGNVVQPPLCEELLRRAQLQAGQVVLDAACGTGLIALEAAELVGPSGACILDSSQSPG